MTQWKLQSEEIEFKTPAGKMEKTKVSKGYQMDDKGNILQQGGAIIPKACQNCGKEFTSQIQEDEMKQELNVYKCKNCEFRDARPDQGMLHITQNPEHKIFVELEQRIVGYKHTLVGTISIITKTTDDVIILCRDCHDLN